MSKRIPLFLACFALTLLLPLASRAQSSGSDSGQDKAILSLQADLKAGRDVEKTKLQLAKIYVSQAYQTFKKLDDETAARTLDSAAQLSLKDEWSLQIKAIGKDLENLAAEKNKKGKIPWDKFPAYANGIANLRTDADNKFKSLAESIQEQENFSSASVPPPMSPAGSNFLAILLSILILGGLTLLAWLLIMPWHKISALKKRLTASLAKKLPASETLPANQDAGPRPLEEIFHQGDIHFKFNFLGLLGQELLLEGADARAAEKILGPFLKETDPKTLAMVARTLYTFSPSRAKMAIRAMLMSPDAAMKLPALDVCVEIADPETMDWLVTLSAQSSQSLKTLIDEAIQKMRVRRSAVERGLRENLKPAAPPPELAPKKEAPSGHPKNGQDSAGTLVGQAPTPPKPVVETPPVPSHELEELKEQIATLRKAKEEMSRTAEVLRQELAQKDQERYEAPVSADGEATQIINNLKYDLDHLKDAARLKEEESEVLTRELLDKQNRLDNLLTANKALEKHARELEAQHQQVTKELKEYHLRIKEALDKREKKIEEMSALLAEKDRLLENLLDKKLKD